MNPSVVNAGELLARPTTIREDVEATKQWVVSAIKQQDGQYIVISRYGDDQWLLPGGATNTAQKIIDFTRLPECFRADAKAMFYRYILKGREGIGKPMAGTVVKNFKGVGRFLKWLSEKHVIELSGITSLHCLNYVHHCKQYKKTNGQSLAAATLTHQFIAVETVYELSQHTNNPMPGHPWPESSACHLSGYYKDLREGKTQSIPDDMLVKLFQKAWELLESADYLLSLRDNNGRLEELGWIHGLKKLNMRLQDLCTACYIILAVTSGCRNHELAYLKNDPNHPDPTKRHPWYSTIDDEGIRYWWMRSRSDKTHTGDTEWMIPAKAVEALRVMERWALPYQEEIENEITMLTANNPHDPQIIEAKRHCHALFLGKSNNPSLVRTLPYHAWNYALKKFARCCGLDFTITTHMFRKTFAVYAAKSPYGDLVYLRDHFKHWSLDMTALYAMNEHQDIDLYGEVLAAKEDIKIGIVEHWLDQETLLTGGAAKNIRLYREHTPELKLFENRKQMAEAVSEQVHIRATAHVWCINDTAGCKSQGLIDRTNCVDCENSVIDDTKKAVWQGIYQQQLELLEIDDFGQAAKVRVYRDVEKVAGVLADLGVETNHKVSP
jgi:integrase